jgi:hypothetical protein
MRSVYPLLVSLALMAAPVPAVLLSTPALAQSPVFPAGSLVEILPAGDVIGDGLTSGATFVLALDASGQPIRGLKLKPTASIGRVDGWDEVGPGLYSFQWTPPAVAAPATATLEVKGRTVDRINIAARVQVAVRPPTASALQVVSNPPQLVLGQDAEASISITLVGAAGDVTAKDIVVRSSVGEIQNLTHLGGGRFTARFVTPRVNYPQLALIGAVDLRDPDRVYGAVAVPLQGKTDYPVQASPGSSVVLRIGDREYGPVTAKPTGRADVPIIVPPGVPTATKIEVSGGQTTEDTLDLRVPETRRIHLLPSRAAVPADGVSPVPIRVAVFTPDGKPDGTSTIAFSGTGGTVSATRALGPGLYEATLVPAFSNVPTTAKITATLTGSSVQTDTMEVSLVPARPTAIALRPQPEMLRPDATALRLFAKVTGPSGQGLDRRDLILAVSGATVKGAVEDLRNGDYRVDFTASGNSHVDVVATVRAAATGNPLARVVLIPQQSYLLNDGASVNRVTVVTVDEFGYPVPDVEVKFKIESGDGTIQQAVRTNEGGVGQVAYTAGRGAGLVRLRAASGNRTGVAYVVQGPVVLQGIALPSPGGSREVAVTEAWRQLITPLRVQREGATAVAGTMETATAQAGALARLQVTSEPATAAAGGKLTLVIQAVDAKGVGVAGLPFDLIVSQGEASAVTDLGGGAYRTTISVPLGAVGEVKVSVASGDTATFLRVPISGTASDAGAWGTTTGPVDGAAAVVGGTDAGSGVVAPPKPPKPPGEGPDFNGYRVRAAYVASSLAYRQEPIATSGPLVPATIAVGGEDGGKPATPVGFEIASRGFFVDYVGYDAGLRVTSWSLTAPEFGGQKVPDSIVAIHADAIGRYPFAVGDDHFWLGGRVGYHGSDILYFTGSFDEARIRYQSLYVQGLGFGGELGGEVGDLYFHGAIGGRLVGVRQWFSTNVDVHVGYQVTDRLFLDAGFGYVDRQVTLLGETSGAELGRITDRQLLGRIGAGVRF